MNEYFAMYTQFAVKSCLVIEQAPELEFKVYFLGCPC